MNNISIFNTSICFMFDETYNIKNSNYIYTERYNYNIIKYNIVKKK